MTGPADDSGTIIALLERMRLQRLPLALKLKDKVERGEKLSESDIEFLSQVFDDNRDVQPILSRHPELASLAGQMGNLYKAITEKALANEKEG